MIGTGTAHVVWIRETAGRTSAGVRQMVPTWALRTPGPTGLPRGLTLHPVQGSAHRGQPHRRWGAPSRTPHPSMSTFCTSALHFERDRLGKTGLYHVCTKHACSCMYQHRYTCTNARDACEHNMHQHIHAKTDICTVRWAQVCTH